MSAHRDAIMPPDLSTWPTRTYYLANDDTTCAVSPRNGNELTTAYDPGSGLLITVPDFDALTEQAIRSAG